MLGIVLRSSVVSLTAVFAFVYGLMHILKGRKGYFYTFSVLGFFSFAIGRIFMTFLYVINFENSDYFNLGTLGVVSGYMCIAFACNAIEIADRIEVQNYLKYKLIALLIPALYLINLAIMITSGLDPDQLTTFFIFLFSVMPCSYYCFRNIITPYPKDSLMRCMKPFFATVLIFSLSTMISEMSWLVNDNETVVIGTYIVLTVIASVCYILMPLFLERGNEKWMRV